MADVNCGGEQVFLCSFEADYRVRLVGGLELSRIIGA